MNHLRVATALYFGGGVGVIASLIFLVLALFAPWPDALVKLGLILLFLGAACVLVGDRMRDTWYWEEEELPTDEEFWRD